MNKTDYEVLLQYVEETDKEFYESLSAQEKILYDFQIRDSLSFRIYFFKERCCELGELLKKSFKNCF